MKSSPYHPITPELAASGMLVTIKQAAADEGACEGTLKTNAKTRRLPAYQARFGAPVMVLLSEVEEFLISRPDIASKHHPKSSPADEASGLPPPASKPSFHSDFPFPDGEGRGIVVGDSGIGITLRSLAHATPAELGLVARIFSEVARQINETLPADSEKYIHHP